MQKSFFPSVMVGYTAEKVLSRNSAEGHLIYRVMVVFVLVTILLLPVLKVTVSVQSNGIIRPITEKNEIKPLVSGTVSLVFVEENDRIDKYQTILTIDTSVSDEKLNLITYEENEQEQLLKDLTLLIENSTGLSISEESFETIHYKSDYLLLKNRLKENTVKQNKAEKELKRYRLLSRNQLTSVSDLENRELALSTLKIERDMLIEEHIAKWNKELLACRLKLKQLQAEHKQIVKEKELCTIKSPISGTLEQFSGISTGSYIQIGQLIAVVSPNDALHVEVYVPPQDIGLIKLGTKAKIQIDAFDYNQWGLVDAWVVEISDDFLPVENQPFFRVRCRLAKTYLTLKNGYKGNLKKGMTVRTRFIVTKRSLFQLLYDQVDDWLNPLQKNV